RCYRDWSSDVCSSDLLSSAPGRRKGGHWCEGYFFATLEDNSSSITCLNDSNGMAPTSRLPLMKKVGVPFAPTALPALMSAWITACPPWDSTDAFHFATSSPISLSTCS